MLTHYFEYMKGAHGKFANSYDNNIPRFNHISSIKMRYQYNSCVMDNFSFQNVGVAVMVGRALQLLLQHRMVQKSKHLSDRMIGHDRMVYSCPVLYSDFSLKFRVVPDVKQLDL